MKSILYIFLLIGCIGIARAQQPVEISGAINFDTAYAISILPMDRSPELTDLPGELGISEDGQFNWSYAISEPQWFQVVFLRKARDRQIGATFPLYLRPGQQLHFQFHYSNDNFLEIRDADSDPGNRALVEYSGFSNRQSRANFMDSPAAEQVLKVAGVYEEEVTNLIAEHRVTDPEVKRYLQLWAANDYLAFLGNRRGASPEGDTLFPEDLAKTLDDEMILQFYNGPGNINRFIEHRMRIDGFAGDDRGEDRLKSIERKLDYTERLFSNRQILDRLLLSNLEGYVTRYQVGSTEQFEQDGERLAVLAGRLSNAHQAERVVRDFRNLHYTQVGSAIPNVVFKDADGREVSMEQFAGSYIYIDLWASWCVPCIREIPFLHELEEIYKDKNIVFVSISLDRDKQAWRDKMAELELSGHQWELGDSGYDQLMNVSGIPHFLLYDPDGRLLQYRAPRPSSTGIRGLFDRL